MRKYLFFVVLVGYGILSTFTTGCITFQESALLQESDSLTVNTRVIRNRMDPYKLQTNDVLSVKVKSLNSSYSDYLNIQNDDNLINFSPLAMYVNGYSIDEAGYIDIPVIGRMRVGGLSLSEAKSLIQKHVDLNLNDAKVFVNLVSFKISVLGEVQNPGYYYVANNQITVLEAVALAGGVAEFGNRTNVRLVRQVKEGSLVTHLNLTHPNLISSPFYFLQPSDVIYIEPLEKKAKRSNLATATLFSTIFTGISTAVAVILLITGR